MMKAKIVIASAVCALLCAPALAHELTGTLMKIKDSGSITLAHRESSIPFSYYDDRQQVIGYSHEIALKVVDAIRQELKLPTLQVQLLPVTTQNRITLVQNEAVDLECGSTTNNTIGKSRSPFPTASSSSAPN